MKTRRVSLADLDAWAAVARNGSFRRTATERGVSPSLLSQTVRRLEEQTGVMLVQRTTRSVALTPAGTYLLGELDPAFARLDAALEGLNQFRATAAGSIRISAPEPVAHHVLAPLVAQFLQRHPDMQIEICADAARADIVRQGFDAGVRFDGDLPLDMVAIPFGGAQRYQVVAAPAYLARAGTPATPQELAGHACIRQRFPGGALFAWRFGMGADSIEIAPRGALTVSDALTAVSAACSGAGIAYAHAGYVREEVRSGALVSLLQEWHAGIGTPYLYYPRQRQMPPSLRQFIDFLKLAPVPGA